MQYETLGRERNLRLILCLSSESERKESLKYMIRKGSKLIGVERFSIICISMLFAEIMPFIKKFDLMSTFPFNVMCFWRLAINQMSHECNGSKAVA